MNSPASKEEILARGANSTNQVISAATPVRVRFAPSPTGFLHVGSARTALFNYLFAKSNKGKFILRIEDTDSLRSKDVYLSEILESLKWLGINWDEGPGIGGEYGPYEQSKRKEIYQKYFDQLVKKNQVYPCFCTADELTQKKNQAQERKEAYIYDETCRKLSREQVEENKKNNLPLVYRLLNPKKEILLDDKVKGKIKFETKLLGDFILVKSDGGFTYNFTNVVDDIEMKISHVIRGDDHLTNTFKQILLFQALNSLDTLPIYAHISLIYGENRQKLSKRHGAISILEFKKAGYYPDPLINHLALLGWSPPDDEEVIGREKLEKSFTELNFSKSPAIFDYKKLDFLNGLYLRNLSDEKILSLFKEKLKEQKITTDHPKINQILLTFKNQCKKVNDIILLYQGFISNQMSISAEDESWVTSDESRQLFQLAKEFLLKGQDEFISQEEFKGIISLSKEKGIKGKNFFMPLRIKLTGNSSGMELSDYICLKTRKEILDKLNSHV